MNFDTSSSDSSDDSSTNSNSDLNDEPIEEPIEIRKEMTFEFFSEKFQTYFEKAEIPKFLSKVFQKIDMIYNSQIPSEPTANSVEYPEGFKEYLIKKNLIQLLEEDVDNEIPYFLEKFKKKPKLPIKPIEDKKELFRREIIPIFKQSFPNLQNPSKQADELYVLLNNQEKQNFTQFSNLCKDITPLLLFDKNSFYELMKICLTAKYNTALLADLIENLPFTQKMNLIKKHSTEFYQLLSKIKTSFNKNVLLDNLVLIHQASFIYWRLVKPYYNFEIFEANLLFYESNKTIKLNQKIDKKPQRRNFRRHYRK